MRLPFWPPVAREEGIVTGDGVGSPWINIEPRALGLALVQVALTGNSEMAGFNNVGIAKNLNVTRTNHLRSLLNIIFPLFFHIVALICKFRYVFLPGSCKVF